MPFSVKTYRGPSSMHGIGLFTAEDIPKGKVLWTFTKRPESVIPVGEAEVLQNTEFLSEEDFEKFTNQEGKRIINHGWAHPQTQKFVILVDGCQWINHSDQENSQYISTPDYRDAYSIALRDIKAGEEIFENYGNYKKTSIPWIKRLLEKYEEYGRINLQESLNI